jgi:hypothetical protein
MGFSAEVCASRLIKVRIASRNAIFKIYLQRLPFQPMLRKSSTARPIVVQRASRSFDQHTETKQLEYLEPVDRSARMYDGDADDAS